MVDHTEHVKVTYTETYEHEFELDVPVSPSARDDAISSYISEHYDDIYSSSSLVSSDWTITPVTISGGII